MYLFLTAYLLLAIPSAAAVLRQKQTPVVAIAWLLAIVLLPIGGSLFYLLAGYRKPVRDVPPTDSRPAAGIERMLWYGCSTRVRYRNRVEQLHDGGEAFAALISALQGARRYIHLSYYIFADDRIGHAIADILVRKARAGVEVRLLYDAIGSWKLSERFVRRLRGAGIEVRAYAPLRFPWFSPRANRRNHSKIAVIDGRTGFVGGINIAERYLDGDALGRWRDEHLRIEGEAVDDLQRLFAADWALEGGEPLSEGLYAAAPADDLPCSPLQIAWTREDRSRTTLTDLFAQLIEEARHTLRISSPYFLPPPALYEALLRAVRRGCRVLVMLPARSDVWLARRATDAYLGELLGAGVEIFRFRGGFLHAKRLIADERVASVGTANFDYRSLEYNTEATALLLDSTTVRQAIRRFDEDLASCTPIDPEAWRRRSVHYRLGDRIARLFAPLL